MQTLQGMISDFIVTHEIVIVKGTESSEMGFCFRFGGTSLISSSSLVFCDSRQIPWRDMENEERDTRQITRQITDNISLKR